MSLLKSILGGKSFLGVDIGTSSIKISEISKIGNSLHLTNYGILETYSYLERLNQSFQTSTLKISEEFTAPMLKLLVQKMKTKVRQANVSLSAFSVFSTLVEIPAMNDSEMKKFIDLQAQQYVPVPLQTVALDWMRVGEKMDNTGTKKSQILLVAIPRDLIIKYQNIFSFAGLKLISVEVEGMSLARVLTRGLQKNSLIIDIGSRSTSLSIANNGYLKSGEQTDFSGGSITQTISNGLNIHPRRAEDFKKERGLFGSQGEHELSTLITPVLDVIIYEAKRILSNFESNYQENADAVFLCGGGSNMIGIDSYFESKLGLKTQKADPFSDINYDKELENILKSIGSGMSVSLGLAIKPYTS